MEKIKVNADGTFEIGEYEFIKFGEENGRVIAVCKDSLFDSRYGKNNNLRESKIMKKLTKEVLPKIENVVGAENVLEFETDLLSLDGSAKYGVMTSKISIPTLDFYRRNRTMFEEHKLDAWWWLATPDSTDEYDSNVWCLCVSPSGCISSCLSNDYDIGVRPFCILNANFFVSCDE